MAPILALIKESTVRSGAQNSAARVAAIVPTSTMLADVAALSPSSKVLTPVADVTCQASTCGPGDITVTLLRDVLTPPLSWRTYRYREPLPRLAYVILFRSVSVAASAKPKYTLSELPEASASTTMTTVFRWSSPLNAANTAASVDINRRATPSPRKHGRPRRPYCS